MNAKDLMDAMNYIDDDLIEACDKVRMKGAKPKKKAVVQSLVPVFAAAATIVVVGAIAVMLATKSDEGARKHSSFDRRDEDRSKSEMYYDGAAYISRNALRPGDVTSEMEFIDGVECQDEEENNAAGQTEVTEAPVNEDPAKAPAETSAGGEEIPETLLINGKTYALVMVEDDLLVTGEEITEYTTDHIFNGAVLYEYQGEDCDMVIYIPSADSFYYLIPSAE